MHLVVFIDKLFNDRKTSIWFLYLTNTDGGLHNSKTIFVVNKSQILEILFGMYDNQIDLDNQI